MTRSLHLETEAIAEVIEAARWYEQQRPGLGQVVRLAIEAALEHVLKYPGSGGRIPGLEDDEQARRHLVEGFPYAVIYTERPGVVRVVAVAHTHRRPGYWQDR